MSPVQFIVCNFRFILCRQVSLSWQSPPRDYGLLKSYAAEEQGLELPGDCVTVGPKMESVGFIDLHSGSMTEIDGRSKAVTIKLLRDGM